MVDMNGIKIGTTNRTRVVFSWKKVYYIETSSGKEFSLKKPIEFTTERRDDLTIFENEELGITCRATNFYECFGKVGDEIYSIYEKYGLEEDDKLSDDGKRLKRLILQHIGPESRRDKPTY